MNYFDNDNEEFEQSQTSDLHREIQNEIKDKVINKLLLTVQKQYNELMFLKKENESLKAHITYILKRILLQKNEYNNINIKKNNIYRTPFKIKNSFFQSSLTTKSTRSRYKHGRSVENQRSRIDNTLFNPSINKSLIDSEDDYMNERINKSRIDQKVKGYLNNIYRDIFLKSRNINTHNLDKSESIYKEIFSFDNKKYKTINNDESFLKEKYGTLKNISQTDNSIFESDSNNKWNLKEDKSIHNIKKNNRKNRILKIKNYNEEEIKDLSNYFDEINETDYNYNDNKDNSLDRKQKKNKRYFNNRNSRNNYGDKIRAKKELLYIKRSPFLVNKY